MFSTLLLLHAIIRWFVIIFLLFSIYRAFVGYINNSLFSKIDDGFRKFTTSFAHIQLMLGMTLYSKSAIVKYFWSNTSDAFQNLDIIFYALLHIALMTIAIVVLTIGSSKAKKETIDKQKFKTILVWFSIALIIIFIAVPWPFSPLSNRSVFRFL